MRRTADSSLARISPPIRRACSRRSWAVPRRRPRVRARGDRRRHRAGDAQHAGAVPPAPWAGARPAGCMCARRRCAARSRIASASRRSRCGSGPVVGLASQEYAGRWPARSRSAAEPAPGPDPRKYEAGALAVAAGEARRPRRRRDCTTHISAMDQQRNMVALTNTAVSLFGSDGRGAGHRDPPENGMIWFDPEAGRPNSVAPGKRALVNMVPVLGFKKGKPYFTLGAPGGRRIGRRFPRSSPRSSPAAVTSRKRSRHRACTRRAVKRGGRSRRGQDAARARRLGHRGRPARRNDATRISPSRWACGSCAAGSRRGSTRPSRGRGGTRSPRPWQRLI